MNACGGRKRLSFISQFVVEALWVSLRSLPPKEAMVALVWRDMMSTKESVRKSECFHRRVFGIIIVVKKEMTSAGPLELFCGESVISPFMTIDKTQ